LVFNLFFRANRPIIKNYIIDGNEIQDKIKLRSRHIGSIHLIFDGELSGKVMLGIDPVEKMDENFPKKNIRMTLEGQIKEDVRCEWFDSQCFLKIIPENLLTKGNIIIEIYSNPF
jgi:hypothetical protein